jgi:chromosome segregation ATPase
MKKLKNLKVILPLLAVMLSVHAAQAQSQQPQTSSASDSARSGIRVNKAVESGELRVERKEISKAPGSQIETRNLLNACAAAAEDLKATRQLVTALEDENAALERRLEVETETTALLTELNETRKSETENLRETVAAKNETIAAKDAVIASQDRLIETLKKKKSSPWKRLGDVLIGVGILAILK